MAYGMVGKFLIIPPKDMVGEHHGHSHLEPVMFALNMHFVSVFVSCLQALNV